MFQYMKREGSTLSAAVLIAGASVGTGFYALPVKAGATGFWPGALVLIAVWLYLWATGLLYLEATLICPDGSNVITICRRLIGSTGMWLGIVCFLLLNYFFLSVLYSFLGVIMENFFFQIPALFWILTSILIFGGSVYLGAYVTDRFNFVLFSALILAFLGTVVLGASEVKILNLVSGRWIALFSAVPYFVTALGYQSLIPSMATYLHRERKRLVWMIFIALLFPLTLYIIWLWVSVGALSEGALWQANVQGKPFYEGYRILTEAPSFHIFFNFLAFFAITTCFLGTGLAMVDFFSDGLGIPVEKRIKKKRLFLVALTYTPPLIILYLFQGIFEEAVGNLVGWAQLVFAGILPIWLVTRGRYILKEGMKPILIGGKPMIALLILVSFFLIYFQGVELIRY